MEELNESVVDDAGLLLFGDPRYWGDKID